MVHVELDTFADLAARAGQEIVVSEWLTMTQKRIDDFAEATGDFQWIHVDPERAQKESPFGATIAHGYLTLSLIAKFLTDSFKVRETKLGVNYGANKVRFTCPVKAGDRIRGRYTPMRVEEVPGGVQVYWNAWIEIEGADKPACIAETISRLYR